MTFSIVGFDPLEKEWGVAVQSKLLAIGALVPWAQAGVGAVATQSFIHTSYGRDSLKWMKRGKTAAETLQLVTAADSQRGLRQVGLIDKNGQAATFTGTSCLPWAGGVTGKHYAIQGNRLVDKQTIVAMESTFATVKGTLAERLLASLTAGQQAGGDRQGQQAAALLIVKENGGYHGVDDRMIDLRVDDHPKPVEELIRLYKLHQLYFTQAKKHRVVPIDADVKIELTEQLIRHGFLRKSETTETDLFEALSSFLQKENFHARMQRKGMIDLDILTYLKQCETSK